MAGNKPALYAAGVTSLGFICLVLASAAVGLPVWAYYEDKLSSYGRERGYFNPWRVCKQLHYNRETCGEDVSRFRPSKTVFASGIVASTSCACLGIFCLLCVIQIAMISSREKVVMKFSSLVLVKVALSLFAALLAIVAAGLFAIQTDDDRNGITITRGLSFYLQIAVIILTIGLFVLSIYDLLFSRRADGDPTKPPEINAANAITFDNPGFRERRTNGHGVAMTVSSGKPYSSNGTNGSVASMNTTMTSMSNGSTLDSVTRSPLRSSLKKPKPRDGLGIQNPGFSGAGQSPTMTRNGSVKKVRIQTHSTEV